MLDNPSLRNLMCFWSWACDCRFEVSYMIIKNRRACWKVTCSVPPLAISSYAVRIRTRVGKPSAVVKINGRA